MTTVEQLISPIRALPPFPNEQFIHRLFNKTRLCASVSILADKLPSADPYGEDQDNLLIDSVNTSQYLELFGEQAAVQALASLDGAADKYNLRGCVDPNNAQVAANNVITNVTSLLYGEHVNWYLRSKNLPNLVILAKTPGFADAFTKHLKDPHFIQSEIYIDMVKHNHDYSLSLLFICEYLHHGAGVVPHVDDEFTSSPSGKVLASWIKQLSHASHGPTKDIVTFCSKAASMVHATTTQGHVEPQEMTGLAKSIFSAASLKALVLTGKEGAAGTLAPMSREAVTLFTSIATAVDLKTPVVDEWKSITSMNMLLWGNTMNNWKAAVIAHTTFQTAMTLQTNTSDGSEFARGIILGLTAGSVDHQTWETTTITGQAMADWINQGRKTFGLLFTKDAPSVVDVHDFTTNNPVSGCFVAGTQIATDQGSVAIETVTEGTKILTHAGAKTYGAASDEDVVSPLSVPFLVGINGDKAFFTPGHVFHTTTGLRAVEPNVARSENHWIDVRQLEPGHVFYRLAHDGKSYDLVQVKSLQVERTDAKVVYGLHLREGHRSYHANGYLVALNYPEITVKSIARMLSTFSQKDRIGMLKHIKELQPLFERFGVSTMSDVLTMELQGEKRRNVAQPLHVGHKQTSNLQHARRTYQLQAVGENSVPGYVLPSLAVHEGVVLVDGKVQPRASIDPIARRICWTRESSEHGYEHAYVEFVDYCLTGRGAVVLSDDSNLELLPHKGARKLVSFTIAKANVEVAKPSHMLNHKNVQRAHPATAAPPPMHAPLPAKPLRKLSPSLMASNAGISVSASAPALADPGTIDGEDYYDLIVDQDTWAKGIDKSAPTKPMKFGQVALATYHTDGVAGLSVPIIVVPHLDQLRTEINKTRSASTHIGPLYSSLTEQDSNGNLVGTVALDEAALISDLADKPSDDVVAHALGLTFKEKLHSSFVLPILFKTLVVRFNWNFTALDGAAYAYDPGMRGCIGSRYKAITARTTSSLTLAVRSANAIAIAATTSSAIASEPAPVTRNLAATVPLPIDALVGISGYSEVSVHSTSQTLLQNMMYFHMNDDDRSQFLQFPRPTDLPIELGQNLPQKMKDWIRDVYAPAYITFMLSQVENKNVTWRGNLTDDEKAKVWYWWSGSGSTCLSKATEYNDINAITAAAAMQKLYGSTLTPYLADGKTYAKKMVDGLKNPTSLNALLKNPINGGVNVINKFCNILNFLDSEGNYADDLFAALLTFAAASNVQNPYIGLDDPEGVKGKEWLFNGMLELGTRVLDNDSSIDPGVRTALQEDLMDLQKMSGDLTNLTNRQKMEGLLIRSDRLLTNLGKWMAVMKQGFSNAYKGFSGFQKAAIAWDKELAKIAAKAPTGIELKMATRFKGIGTIVMAAMYIGVSINAFMNWDIFDPAARATLIFSTLQMAVDIAARSTSFIGTFKNYKEWKGKPNPSLDQSVDARVLDQGTGNVLSSKNTIANLEREAAIDAGPLGLKGSVAERMSEFGRPERAVPVSEDEFAMPVNEDPKVPLPEDVTPGVTSAARNFNGSAAWFKAANILLGIGITVSMSYDLKNHWNDMNLVGKILGTVQIYIQTLAIVCDVIALGAEAGLLSLSVTAAFALPIFGAVIAVIGLTIMVILMSIDTAAKKDPPPTPVETFLDVAHVTVARWMSQPAIALQYDVPASVNTGSSPATITFGVTNPTSQKVVLTQTAFTLEGGDDAACFFKNISMAVATSDATKNQDGNVHTDPSSLVSGALTSTPRGEKVVSYDFHMSGTSNDNNKLGQLVLQPKENFTVTWTGIVNKVGSTTLQIIETLGDGSGDHCRLLKTIQRV